MNTKGLFTEKKSNGFLVILMILWMPFEALFKMLFRFLFSRNLRTKFNSFFYQGTDWQYNNDRWCHFIIGILVLSLIIYGIIQLLVAAYTGAIWAIIPG